MSAPLPRQILSIRDGIPSDEEESPFPVGVVFSGFEDGMLFTWLVFEKIPVRSMADKVIHFRKLRHCQIDTMLLNDPLMGEQNPPDHGHRLDERNAGKREKGLGKSWKRINVSYGEWGDWKGYPGFRGIVA